MSKTTATTETPKSVKTATTVDVEPTTPENASTLKTELKTLHAAQKLMGAAFPQAFNQRIAEIERIIAVTSDPLAAVTAVQRAELDTLSASIQKYARTLPTGVRLVLTTLEETETESGVIPGGYILELRGKTRTRNGTVTTTGTGNAAPGSIRSLAMLGHGNGGNTGSPYDTLKIFKRDANGGLVPWYTGLDLEGATVMLDSFLHADGSTGPDDRLSLPDAMTEHGIDEFIMAGKTLSASVLATERHTVVTLENRTVLYTIKNLEDGKARCFRQDQFDKNPLGNLFGGKDAKEEA